MRGTLGRRVVGLCLVGIIPAYAGNTTARNASTKAKRDHPRICGEHSRRGSAGLSFGGSSPRMRGTPFVVIAVTVWRGIIPAYAGNTLPVLPNPFSPRDHPRVCGEHGEIDVCMAGNMGSSPRMRGTRQERVERRGRLGIIPAYAGNTRRESTAAQYPEDHPRVCGEHFHSWFGTVHGLGSSPRMRGTRNINPRRTFRMGIIPAYAGNTTERSSRATATRDHPGNTRRDRSHEQYRQDHPRVCGEHSSRMLEKLASVGSSPRMRGTPVVPPAYPTFTGIIPAYAGNTPRPDPWTGFPGDHPRVCGEHRSLSDLSDLEGGSSPRMRGTPVSRLRFYRIRGIIPAYAGNTALKLKI